MLRRHFFLAAALAVLVLMVLAGGLRMAEGKGGPEAKGGPGGGGGRPAAQVSQTVVQPRPFVDAIDVLGVAKGRRSVTLTAAATQLVQKVNFSDGQRVGRGAVLVELKDTEQDAALAQAQARLEQARRAYQRWQALAQRGFASKASLDQYEADFRAARADVRAAEARRADRMIRAPFSGVVGLSDIAPGALVNPGAAIVTLDDLSAVRVDFEIPERYLGSVREGQPIVARPDAYPGVEVAGRIARLDTRVDERTRAVTARAEFPNPGDRLKPGMLMRVAISRGERQGLSAPESAVSVQGDAAFVFLIVENGGKTVAEQRPVVTGARQGGFVELLEGVQSGDRIVADGLNKVQGGQAVRLVRAQSRQRRPPA